MATSLRILPLLMVLHLAHPAYSQDIDHLMTERIHSPLEIHLNLARHVARLHYADQPDSVDLLLEIWKERAPGYEIVHRVDTLWRLHRGTFTAREIDRRFFEQIVNYRRWTESLASHDSDLRAEEAQRLLPPFDPRFLMFLDELAEEAGTRAEPATDEQLVSLVYRDRFAEAFGLMRSDATRWTALHREREAMVDGIHDGTEQIYSLSTVYWTPGGGVDPIGSHPGVNLEMRSVGARYLGALSTTFLFGDSDATFVFERDGELIFTDDFVGLDVFLDGGRHVFRTRQHTTTAFVGAGISLLRWFFGGENPRESVSVTAFAPSVGLQHRLRPWRYSSWSFEAAARYSITDYDGDSGLELKGNNLTVSIGFGGSLGFNPYEALRWLD